MPNWLQNNLATLIYVLAVLIPAIAQGLKVLAEKKREADAKRLRESAGQSHSAPGQPVMVSSAESATASPTAASRQDQLAAQRQAQIEMWKAREAAMRRTNQPTASTRSAEDELARRRRVAMEELRRRQVEADRARASQSQTLSRRQQAAMEPERRRQAGQRAARSNRQQPAATPVVEQIVASLAPPSAAEPMVRLAPARRAAAAAPLVLDAKSLRQTFIMKELLDPPVAMREGTAGSSPGYHLPF